MIFTNTELQNEIASLKQEVLNLKQEIASIYRALFDIKWTDAQLAHMERIEKSYKEDSAELRKEWKDLLMRLASK